MIDNVLGRVPTYNRITFWGYSKVLPKNNIIKKTRAAKKHCKNCNSKMQKNTPKMHQNAFKNCRIIFWIETDPTVHLLVGSCLLITLITCLKGHIVSLVTLWCCEMNEYQSYFLILYFTSYISYVVICKYASIPICPYLTVP